ncbi:MAG: CDP-diacylglycerol--glycerol-3-phosphate 3-phosphatidyltransferase [Chthoniobacterales bacterium]
MNWANRLTVARFFLTIAFVMAMTSGWTYTHTLALAIFVVASVTDYLDGWVARKYSMQTPFGALMDPLVDKIMTAAAFICLIPLGAIPAWVAVVIISREFVITGLRLLASSQGRVLVAESIGKHKTGWQIATIIFFLLEYSVAELFPKLAQNASALRLAEIGESISLIAAVGLTIYSGISYLWRHRAIIQVE